MKVINGFNTAALVLMVGSCFSQQINKRIGVDTTQSMFNYDAARSMLEKNGTYYVVGETKKTLSMANGQVYDYGTFMKLNSTGSLIFSRRSSFKKITSIDVTNDDKFIVAGTGSGFMCTSGMCKADMLVAKIDANATVVWGRSFGNANYNGSDGIKYVKQTSDNNVVAVGNLYQTTNTSHPFICKLNGSNGDSIWARTLPMNTGWGANHVSETTGGDLYVALSNGSMVSKLSSAGTHLWTVSLSQYGEVIRTAPQSDGSVICFGHCMVPSSNNYNLCVFKLSSTGTLIWFKVFDSAPQVAGGQEWVTDCKASQDGGYYIGGYYYSNTTYIGEFPFVAKVDANGNMLWVRSYPGAYSEVSALYERPNNNLMVCIKLGAASSYHHPDIVINTFDTFGNSNTCWNTFSLTAVSQTATASSKFPGNWTGFESQVTNPVFNSQNNWQGQYCSNSTVQLGEEEMHKKNFNVKALAFSNVEIIDQDGSSFNYSVYDLNGKVIRSGRSENTGTAIVNLQDVGGQLLIVRAWSDDERKMEHFKFLHK